MGLTMLHHGHRLTLGCDRADSKLVGDLADPHVPTHAMPGLRARPDKVDAGRRPRLEFNLAASRDLLRAARDAVEFAGLQLASRRRLSRPKISNILTQEKVGTPITNRAQSELLPAAHRQDVHLGSAR